MSGDREKRQQAARRARDSYRRKKLNLRAVQLDLPPDDLTRFVVGTGWLSSRKAADFDNVRRAASTMICSMISKFILTREGKDLQPVDDRVSAQSNIGDQHVESPDRATPRGPAAASERAG